MSHYALEAIALNAYNAKLITAAEVQQILKLSSYLDTDAFLRQHEVFIPYTLDDSQQDIRAIAQVLNQHNNHHQ